ncbi:translocating chain-associated membrane protein 1-like [Teleopsis dalmanni]|uniref:translocating chain-associated membrane protein 1-like n=1 Tax=Teleopsis dalmanni TaxID=139649 RepID=UPI0018CE4214|nr:translocating chain-associated membrane protein 1-like [Teleopsis dalmanni]XP_037951783.1 translocating chain-associated membrane protein 1-like [Teleopsis dalmanni]XP_037951784.1 translocating chain-associated membrane protein 1-like [Teleopsis dalmanni]
MRIRPGMGRKSSNKNPQIFSHEFVIHNHADIVSCLVMIFVVGLLDETTSHFTSAFVTLQHNVTGQDSSRDNPTGRTYTYVAGIKDYCSVFFYTLTCIIMHAIIQEFLLDKCTKKLHLSKYKLAIFNESGQLIVFYIISVFWGGRVILREGYFTQFSLLWEDFPKHPMTYMHKFFFIIQMAYYLHMLPELYFQKVKKEDQQSKILHSIFGFGIICLAYSFGFQRITIVLLTLHYVGEIVTHIFQLIDIFDRNEKLLNLRVLNSFTFVSVRFLNMVIGVLTLYYGIANTESTMRALFALFGLIVLQGYLIFSFITEYFRMKREEQREARNHQLRKPKSSKDKLKRRKESDLPEVDQHRMLK